MVCRDKKHNFTQKLMFISTGDQIGSGYSDLEKSVKPKYPSIEAYNRAWHSSDIYQIDLQIKPDGRIF
jgi:hypothetical protein